MAVPFRASPRLILSFLSFSFSSLPSMVHRINPTFCQALLSCLKSVLTCLACSCLPCHVMFLCVYVSYPVVTSSACIPLLHRQLPTHASQHKVLTSKAATSWTYRIALQKYTPRGAQNQTQRREKAEAHPEELSRFGNRTKSGKRCFRDGRSPSRNPNPKLRGSREDNRE